MASGIEKLIQETIARCIPCKATGRLAPPQSMTMSDMPFGSWQNLLIDFYGPLPSGEYLFEIDRSTRAATVFGQNLFPKEHFLSFIGTFKF